MKKTIQSLVFLAAAVMAFSACEKWVQTEPITVVRESLESKNPALYEAYLSSLRAYHETEHPVLIAKFDNIEGQPSGRAQQVAYLPDSVDFVILTRAQAISEQTSREIEQIRSQKGIRTLAQVNLKQIQKQYEALVDAEREAYNNLEDPATGSEPVDTPERLSAYAGEQLSPLFDAIEREKLDGICVTYSYMDPASFPEETFRRVQQMQQALFTQVNGWMAGRENALVFFEGIPGHVLCETQAVTAARYIIIPALSASSHHSLGNETEKALLSGTGAPRDRVVIGVTTLDPWDAAATDGKFSGGISAIVGAARWCVTPSSIFVKKGVCVDHAQNDYYNVAQVYSEIGQAISIMNPSPVK